MTQQYDATPVPDRPDNRPSRRRSTRARTLGMICMAATVAIVAWLCSIDPEGEAVRQLPATERRALYERTLESLGSSCDPARRPDGLDAFCYQQAQLIVRFPECDERCTELARRQRHIPTR